MRVPNRRQALVTLGAASFGIVAAGAPDLFRGSSRRAAQAADHQHMRGPDGKPIKGSPSPSPTYKDPAYAPGIHAANPAKPVFSLADLVPAATPTAIALTLDDGPHPTYTPMMLDILAEHDVKATFSMIGEQVTELPSMVARVVAAGHQVSNHTVTHPLNLPYLTNQHITTEIIGCWDRISHVSGHAPHLFRSPGGAWSKAILETATGHGMTCLDWTIDPRDWDQPASTVAHISSTLRSAKAGDILLSHDGGGDRTRTAAALRIAIPALKAKGFTFVAL